MKLTRLDHGMDKNCLLALGDLQQRRIEGAFTDEWGRHLPALPRADLLNWGADAIFDVVDRKPKFGATTHAGADRCRELRRAQWVADSGPRTRHHGAGVVPGRRLGVRLHGFGKLFGSRSSIAVRSTRSTSSPAGTGRPTTRLYLWDEIARASCLQAHAERVSVAERLTRLSRQGERVQRAAV